MRTIIFCLCENIKSCKNANADDVLCCRVIKVLVLNFTGGMFSAVPQIGAMLGNGFESSFEHPL